MALRPAAVGHNLDFPETDSDLVCAKDVFLTTYILACALLVTFQPPPALLVILSKQCCVICGPSFCVGSTEFDAPSLTNAFSKNNQQRSALSCIPLCRSGIFFFWSLKSCSPNVSALASLLAFESFPGWKSLQSVAND